MSLLQKVIYKNNIAIVINITELNEIYITYPYYIKDKLYGYIRKQVNENELIPFN